MEECLKMAKAIAYKRWNNGLKKKYTLDEVQAEAFFGLAQALKKYEDKGATLLTYSYKVINWRITNMAQHDKEKFDFLNKQDRNNLSLNYEYEAENVTIEKYLSVNCKGIETIENNDTLKPLYSLERGLLEPLVAYYFEDFTQKEIAEMMGLSVNAVNNRIMRAKYKLREIIAI